MRRATVVLAITMIAAPAMASRGGHHGGFGAGGHGGGMIGGHHGHSINAWMGNHRPRLR